MTADDKQPVSRWQVWRRRQRSWGPWQEVFGIIEAPSKLKAHDVFVLYAELTMCWVDGGPWEYMLTPAGKRPQERQIYRHRMMSPLGRGQQ